MYRMGNGTACFPLHPNPMIVFTATNAENLEKACCWDLNETLVVTIKSFSFKVREIKVERG